MNEHPVISAAPQSHAESGEEFCFGPSRAMVYAKALSSPVNWLSACAVAGGIYIADVDRAYEFMLSLPPQLAEGFGQAYVRFLHTGIVSWAGALVMILETLRHVVTYFGSDYRLVSGVLEIRHGYFSRHSPGGFFREYVDSIALNLVVDVDVVRNPAEQLAGSGMLRIRTAGGQTALVPFVKHPDLTRRTILGRSGTMNARTYAVI